MKPAPFTYHRPEHLDEALTVLHEYGDTAKVLAGGQSLMPMLSMRLLSPAHLVDINRLTELDKVTCDADGVRIGALARHADVEHDASAARIQPLLEQALKNVAHPTIRNRGTTVGSLVHADPSGELTAVLALLGGRVAVASTAGRREIPAQEFFLGVMESALRPGELAVEAFFPALPVGARTSFLEVSRRSGDYALCGVALLLSADGRSARVAYLSMGPTPAVLDLDLDTGRSERETIRDVVAQLEPEDDVHADAGYRRHLAQVLTARALHAARSADPSGTAQ